jgi:carbon-monoxide dehydrogenase large subunit
LEAAAEDIQVFDGVASVVGTDRRMSFRQLARAVYSEMGRIPADQREELGSTQSYDPIFGTSATAAHLAVVEVNPQTYQVRVERFIVAEDCGRIVNPMIVDGQVHGGVAQGIGAALFEEVVFNEDGQPLTASLVDYLIPTAAEIPDIEVVHIEADSPTTLGGYRGMGEGGTIGAPAAIANALSDALSPLGIEITDLPATPERLHRLVESARSLQGLTS